MIDFFKFEWIRRKFRPNRSEKDIARDIAEELKNNLKRMTPWESHMGKLYSPFFVEDDNNETSINCGLLKMLLSGLLGGRHEHLKADQLLKSTPEDVFSPSQKMFKVLSSDNWGTIVLESGRSRNAPATAEVIEYLRELLNHVVQRPSPENMDRFLIGYYCCLADYVFTIGLFINLEWPEFAQELLSSTRSASIDVASLLEI
jgi:hypothetical protein